MSSCATRRAVHHLKRRAPLVSLERPVSKIVCIGRNYTDHISELQNAKPKQPFFFLKPPSAILLPGHGPVLRPRGVELHHEVELALIMGKRVDKMAHHDVPLAIAAIEQYALAIDMTARNVQDEAKKKGLPWDIAKGFNTFLPLSKPIPKTLIPDPHEVELFLHVNGQPRQRGSTNLMIHRIPRILCDIAKVMTLQPGDIVLTGTPAGVGPVVPGDIIRAGVTVDGYEVDEGIIEVRVEESKSTYNYTET
ncbi:2-keto-4-pentenoate hydratase [Ophiocordyceps camponoti-floridani]|uniref:2-keto-4-pentenoate hydratase n=1 Tax=Ophiocordyceps camponoti-floridani TaxID=2030778 RepID=A0A8H4QBM2_9HYPO|nr:2-keto-4-pentenoate hydratase [Ophiocordyceps camponoti-floridani]